MTEQFVPYDMARILRKKGFIELCIGWWYNPTGNKPDLFLVEGGEAEDNNSIILDPNQEDMQDVGNWKQICEERKFGCSAPLWQQVIDWFLEKYEIDIETHYNSNLNKTFQYQIHTKEQFCKVDCDVEFKTKKEMLENAINEALELI